MSDRDELIPGILAAAIAAAGPRGTNDGAWKAKINAAIPHVVSMMNDASKQWRIAQEVLGAAVFMGEYRGFSIEASSTRAIVRIDTGKPSKNYPDGVEEIRTHRTDNSQGKAMLEILEHIPVDTSVVVWKALEAVGDGADAQKVRVLVHIETRPKFTPKSPGPNQGDRQPERSEPRHSDPGPPSEPAYTDSIDSDRIVGWRAATVERLTDRQLASLIDKLSQRGYTFEGVSEIEWVDIVRPLIREIVK